mgnify:CR=1 FL=1
MVVSIWHKTLVVIAHWLADFPHLSKSEVNLGINDRL